MSSEDSSPKPKTDLWFGTALNEMFKGNLVGRVGWHRKKELITIENPFLKFVAQVKGGSLLITEDHALRTFLQAGESINIRSHFVQRLHHEVFEIWTPTPTDVMARDWFVLPYIDGDNLITLNELTGKNFKPDKNITKRESKRQSLATVGDALKKQLESK